MPQGRFPELFFLVGGGLLAGLGLILWFVLPIAAMFPPYLVTSVLALGYGTACFWIRLAKS